MNQIVANTKYKINYQLPWAALAIAIYMITIFLTFYILIKSSIINQNQGSLVYRIWALIPFQFSISLKFREDFDFLLTLSNTRNNIFQSLLSVAIFFSLFFSSIIILERLIVDSLNRTLGYTNITDPFHFFSPYTVDSVLLQFIFFLMLCAAVSVFGLLMGSLFYRFGKKFTLAFWLMFASLPMVILPLFLWPLFQRGQLSEFWAAVGKFLGNFDVMAGSGYLFIMAIVFGIAAYFNIHRLPQR